MPRTLNAVQTDPAQVPFSFAFQPIVDTSDGSVFSYEALIRGPAGEPPGTVFRQVAREVLLDFDQLARERAIRMAAHLGITCRLNLNFLPSALLYRAEHLEATLDAALANGLAASQLVVELTENEIIDNHDGLARRFAPARRRGSRFAIDDFGAGYAGLNLLAEFQPDFLKLDMQIVRGIDAHGPRQSIVRAVLDVCVDLGIDVIAEGVETASELACLQGFGIELFQGYLLARPGFEALPVPVAVPVLASRGGAAPDVAAPRLH